MNPAAVVPQAHGGALQRGNPGNRGGPGRPRNLVRAELLESYDRRKAFLADVIDGKVMQRLKFPILELARHVECRNCGEVQLQAKDKSVLEEIEIEVSASTKDRIAAAEHLAKYSMGQLREISTENVQEKLARQLELLRNRFAGEVLSTLLRDLREIWNS